MWPALVLGILTAIFAWIWYRGGEEAKDPETQEQKNEELAVTPETGKDGVESEPGPLGAHLASGECSLPADDHELNTTGQEVPCIRFQERKAENPETYEAKNEEKSELQGKDQEGPADVDHIETGLEVLTPVTTHVPTLTDHQSNPPAPELPGNTQEHPSDVPKEEELQKEHPSDRSEKEALQADIGDPTTDVLKKETNGNIKENHTDLPIKEVLQADIQEQPTDVPAKEELQADTQKHLSYVPKTDEQAITLEHQAAFPVKGYNLLENHVKDVVQTCADENYKEISSENEIHSHEVEAHPSEIPEAKQILNEEEYTPLIQEMQFSVENPQNLGKAAEQATGEAKCSTLMAEEPGEQILPADSCHESVSAKNKENEGQDGFCATGELNGENQAAIDATGCPLENAFVVKENALNLCQAKERLNKDLYLEMGNTSNHDGNANSDQFMKRSVEKCDMRMCIDTVNPSTGFLDDADLHAGTLHVSPQEGSAKVQKLETLPDSSSVDIYNLEKEMAGLSGSNTDDKTSNIHENENQKTRKVATIQPMPQNVNFVFKVHYITHSDSQIIAITGDHEKLGKWETCVPLTSGNSGFWSHTITLPADTSLAWKFVMVENGKIKRWEECNNRFLKTAHEDIEAQLWWGYP